jgi:hypothetical protein
MADLLRALQEMNHAFRIIQESLFHVNMFFWNLFGISNSIFKSFPITLIVILIIGYVVSKSPLAREFISRSVNLTTLTQAYVYTTVCICRNLFLLLLVLLLCLFC